MTDGPRITRAGQMQLGSVLIDAGALSSPDSGVDGDRAVEGLFDTPIRSTDDTRVSGGLHRGRRVLDGRTITVPLVSEDADQHATILAGVYVEDLDTPRDLVFRGFGWPDSNKYRVGVVPSTAGKSTYDELAALGDAYKPTLVLEAADPHIYAFSPSTATMSPAATHTQTGGGTHSSHRLTLTFFGPWDGPGFYINEFPALGVCWPNLSLESGQGIFVQCDPFSPNAGFGSFEIDYFTLWGGAKAPTDTTFPFKYLPAVLAGSQTFKTTGTGSGHVDVAWHPAFVTPEVT